ncbi:hypothetical protein [Nocardia sp. NPDC050717]|uniref:hypothetical protein n=1 Tax=Nocardia sp. NPDC050717 TaxID=3157221 RepID=UPI0033C1B8D8
MTECRAGDRRTAVVAQVLTGVSALVIVAIVGHMVSEIVHQLTAEPNQDGADFRLVNAAFVLIIATISGAIGVLHLVGLRLLLARNRRGRGVVLLAAPLAMTAAFLFSALEIPLITLTLMALFATPMVAVALPGTKRWLLTKPAAPEPAWPAEPEWPAR